MSALAPAVKAGDTFTHHHMLDVGWVPDVAAGEKYRDAPHARMAVTAVRDGRVWFKYATEEGPGQWVANRRDFLAEYGGELVRQDGPMTILDQLSAEYREGSQVTPGTPVVPTPWIRGVN